MGRSGVAAGDLLLLIAQNIDVLVGPVISLAYPLCASIRAIETKNVADDQQWLTYWVLYSMITLLELTFAALIEWIPIFWSYAKLIITCWLVIPQFSGAAYVYQHYIRPFYVGNRTINVFYVPSKKDLFMDPTQDDVVVSADKYIREIGPDAFSGYGYVQESLPQETIQHFDMNGETKYRGNIFFSEDDYVY